ncbi:mediator of RNA polymerase II transcription subunit 19a isoform X1 [Manihot esculenta]|uniref:Mediator of RNA polymerase II transcription subunit 19 n=2 Tax=Manihot esculenta TaxID=3983 RepID=A0A251J667_MANES|nr:mediator of RNA polymerase II transcription subunit 19a isoform X1 [Manihot esculenta]XP_021593836.1 mediator of RNA polymerase II transcription subunit 19a isoform X1 [Manihot esculenta]XP_043806782.1 mediator of RNA polymerase II transcription subunit 19a isoform X1 [Manihot esculenta]XP_043806783.1 mediator of RNA polymerase II transcription subunit 19a isoform X1 [Manihot esculenta]KAG8637476.1 hypothetical protein MANES_15G125700v8 [Manihot esculenta]OAY29201.1 hypothetical protein MAN
MTTSSFFLVKLMDEGKAFGGGPRELGGAVDLINQYKLWPHHELFCKRSLPLSISETHYFRNVVGDTQIRKGEGMELDQLFHNASYLREKNSCIHPFDIGELVEAFHIRETTPLDLPSAERGVPTATMKSTTKSTRDEEMKHKKRGDKEKKHKHHKKDGSHKDRKRSGIEPGIDSLKKQPDKMRRYKGF